MASVERKTMDILAEMTASKECSNSGNHDKANDFLERTTMCSISISTCFICSICIVLVRNYCHINLNAFCCARLQSRDAKSMLNVATFLKTAVLPS